VLSEAQGNPLALLELPAALTERQRASGQDLPPTLPLTRRLLGLFGEQLQKLSPASRQVLLMLALDSTGDARVARPGSYTPAEPDAVEAEQAGLVHSRPGTRRLDFRHPLVRAAVVELSTSSERRAAHQALAELAAGQPDRQAWHFAEAATGPDERVAELLERSARRRRIGSDGRLVAPPRGTGCAPASCPEPFTRAARTLTGGVPEGGLRCNHARGGRER
jgi:hypothetical protein